jgi:hypothetical protein
MRYFFKKLWFWTVRWDTFSLFRLSLGYAFSFWFPRMQRKQQKLPCDNRYINYARMPCPTNASSQSPLPDTAHCCNYRSPSAFFYAFFRRYFFGGSTITYTVFLYSNPFPVTISITYTLSLGSVHCILVIHNGRGILSHQHIDM